MALAGEEGVNNVSGLRFIIDDTDVYMAEARKDALTQIEEKKQELAIMLGVQIGAVTGYYEYESNNQDFGGYYDRAYAMEDSFGFAPDIESGTEEVSVDVSVTFELL